MTTSAIDRATQFSYNLGSFCLQCYLEAIRAECTSSNRLNVLLARALFDEKRNWWDERRSATSLIMLLNYRQRKEADWNSFHQRWIRPKRGRKLKKICRATHHGAPQHGGPDQNCSGQIFLKQRTKGGADQFFEEVCRCFHLVCLRHARHPTWYDCHRLNIDAKHKLVRQKKRSFVLER